MNKKQELFEKIIELCKKRQYHKLNKSDIARELNISPGLIYHYFESIEHLKKEIIQFSVDNRIVRIVADGLGVRDSIALSADESLRVECANLISGV